jgi:hypothetical protein
MEGGRFVKKRLIIVSSSSRVVGSADRAVAGIDRYDGLMMRVVRKWMHEAHIGRDDILLVSPIHGLVRGQDPIDYHPPAKGDWRNPELDEPSVEKMNRSALILLRELTTSRNYSEIYVNVGKRLYPIIAGFENMLHCKIVYAKGNGFGPKAAHMRDWMLSR